MRSRRMLTASITIGAIAALLPLGLNRADAAVSLFDFPCSSAGTTTGDFNNDGRPDLAVGAPGDDLEQQEVDGSITQGVTDSGSINVTYSTADGLDPAFLPHSSTRNFFSQNTPAISGSAEKDDSFGFSLAAGNFDGRGGDDLAIGIPGENGAGAVQILYSGGPTATGAATTVGLSAGVPTEDTFNRVITQNSAFVDGISEAGDQFGYAVAAGFINGDRFADLVIGVPKEDIGTRKDAGMVQVIFGSDHGLDPTGSTGTGVRDDQFFQQGSGVVRNPEIARTEPGDFFGASLAIGQFDDESPSDVAVGAPGEDVGNVPDGGSVQVLYSAGGGLSAANADFFHQSTALVDGIAEPADRFGCALGAGNFDGDADDDLAIGVPGESIGADKAAGYVHVIYSTGRAIGISADPRDEGSLGSWAPDQVWTEDEGGIPGVSKPDDRMGGSLATADFDGDGVEDLAIGLPTELLFEHKGSGSVRVLSGFDGGGLTDLRPTAFGQSPHDLASSCPFYGISDDLSDGDECFFGPAEYTPLLMIEEEGDRFGASLAAADFNSDGEADLSIGAPNEDLGQFVNWLLEEEATIPDETLTQLGIPVPLGFDEAKDAGSLNIVYGQPGGWPSPPNPTPLKQDVLYREGGSPFGGLRSFLHTVLEPILQDNQIPPSAGDPSATTAIAGDTFGTGQS